MRAAHVHKEKPMKELLLFLVVILATALTACHSDDPAPAPSSESERTVLVYMVAENSLGYYGCHRDDSTEIMEGRQYVTDADRMLFFMDSGGSPTLYRARADRQEPEVVMRWEADFCSTNPERLREVLDTVKSRCPAREYGLVMWSHSDGWISPTNTNYSSYESPKKQLTQASLRPFSFGIDSGGGSYSNNGAEMGMEDIAAAVSGAGMHMKYIFFDSCLMGNVEVAYALRNVTDFLVASPIATPGAGTYYTNQLKNGFFSDTPSDICATYIQDVESEELKSSYEDIGLVISCVRSDMMEPLAAAIRQALPYSCIMNRQSAVMDTVLAYQAYTPRYHYRPHNYDVLQSLRNILPDGQFQTVQGALQAAIVYFDATGKVWIGPNMGDYIYPPLTPYRNFCGLSMFVPQDIYTQNAGVTRHGDLNENFQETEWYEAAGFAQTGW